MLFRSRDSVRVVWDFDLSCSLVRSAPPYMRFLFVGSELCLRLPSDSPHGGHPCRSTNTSYYQACSGLSPPSYCPCWAYNIRKTVISDGFNGADGRIQTGDLILTNDVGKEQSNQFANPIVFCAGPGRACLKPVIITVSCHIRAALHETPDAWNIPSCTAA